MSHRLILRPRDGITPVISNLALDEIDGSYSIAAIKIKSIRFINGSITSVDRAIDIGSGQPRAVLTEGDAVITYNVEMGTIVVTESDRTIKAVAREVTLTRSVI